MYVRWVQPYPWPWGSDSTVAIVTRGFPDTVVTHGFLDTVMTPEVRQDQRGFSTMAPQVMLVDRAPLVMTRLLPVEPCWITDLPLSPTGDSLRC